jgi:hypothetical protein
LDSSNLFEAEIITLVNLLPSGSQIRLTASTLIGKKRFSINLLSFASASINQTLTEYGQPQKKKQPLLDREEKMMESKKSGFHFTDVQEWLPE